MVYRHLGKTGLELSLLGFGSSPLGNEFGEADPQEADRVVHAAIDSGINYFDTAPYYGRGLSEERLGKALKGFRDKVILATKVGRYDKAGFDFSASRVKSSLEESLQRLQTDYIDVLQVHDIEFAAKEQIIHETLPALLELKKLGHIGFIAITGYPLYNLKVVAEAFPVDAILSYCRYNLLDQSLDEVLTPLVQTKGLGLINASPLHMRALTMLGAPDWHPAPKRVKDAARAAVKLCREQAVDLAQIAVHFALQHPLLSTTLVGMDSVKQLEQNLAALHMKPDAELLTKLQELLAPVKNTVWLSGLPENNDPAAFA